MFSRKKVYIQVLNIFKRHYAQKPRPKVEFDPDVGALAESESFKPRKHPGVLPTKRIELPQDIVNAIKVALGDVPFKGVLKDSVKLANYLHSRNYPAEEWEVNRSKEAIEKKVAALENADFTNRTEEEAEKFVKERNKKVEKLLKETVHAWKNIQLDKYLALQYLVNRGPADYTALCRIFHEINAREENYAPTSFFDFGSGVGTGTWAARQFWGESLQEIFTVDTSSEVNDLARLILCGGLQDGEPPLKKFFQRQFLPAQPVKYNIVLSAFSLFEIPSAKARLMTIQNLWKKTNDFLILVELGTNAGFRIINEARDFILQTQEGDLEGHVYSPCPHDDQCPRYVEDVTPCNFLAQYKPLTFDNRGDTKNMLISYVILKKGKRPEDDQQWPRIVRPVLVRSKHSICRMCCADGKLNEIIFTASKHGKVLYRCARASSWGDRLPINIKENISEELESEIDFQQNSEHEDEIEDSNSTENIVSETETTSQTESINKTKGD